MKLYALAEQTVKWGYPFACGMDYFETAEPFAESITIVMYGIRCRVCSPNPTA